MEHLHAAVIRLPPGDAEGTADRQTVPLRSRSRRCAILAGNLCIARRSKPPLVLRRRALNRCNIACATAGISRTGTTQASRGMIRKRLAVTVVTSAVRGLLSRTAASPGVNVAKAGMARSGDGDGSMGRRILGWPCRSEWRNVPHSVTPLCRRQGPGTNALVQRNRGPMSG